MPYWRQLVFVGAAKGLSDQSAITHGQIQHSAATMVPIQTGVSAQTRMQEPLASFFS
jgi:hypothetical protein